MNPSSAAGRQQLRTIARRVMTERGLLPDFSPAVLAQTGALRERVVETGPAIRDLRDLAWSSIDNDDTRDLDQLSVAAPLAGGVVKLLVAVADVDATVAEGSAIDGRPPATATYAPSPTPAEKPEAPQPAATARPAAPPTGKLTLPAKLGAVTFDHEKHAGKLGIACTTCHHPSRPQKPLASENQACRDCHAMPAAPPRSAPSMPRPRTSASRCWS